MEKSKYFDKINYHNLKKNMSIDEKFLTKVPENKEINFDIDINIEMKDIINIIKKRHYYALFLINISEM